MLGSTGRGGASSRLSGGPAGGGEDAHSAAARVLSSQERFLMGKKIRSEIDDFPRFYIWQFTTFPTMVIFYNIILWR